MQATKETVQKRPHTALWIILCVVRRAMWPPRG